LQHLETRDPKAYAQGRDPIQQPFQESLRRRFLGVGVRRGFSLASGQGKDRIQTGALSGEKPSPNVSGQVLQVGQKIVLVEIREDLSPERDPHPLAPFSLNAKCTRIVSSTRTPRASA